MAAVRSFGCSETDVLAPSGGRSGSATRMPLAALCCAALWTPAFAEDALKVSSSGRLTVRTEGRSIARVDVVLAEASAGSARAQSIAARLRTELASLEGSAYSQVLVESLITAPRGRMGTGRISYRVLDAPVIGSVVLRVEVDTTADADTDAAKSGAFPTLHRDERSYLTAILNGGFGIYSDGNPWFGRPDLFTKGSPIAGSAPGRQPLWTEGFVEVGLGGATQLGSSPWYGYGALTGITSWSLGQDIYRGDTRSFSALEKGYAGLLYVDPGTGYSFNISGSRQNVTLNDGFIVHFVRGSANIGERGGIYLGPRNANGFSVFSDLNIGRWSFKAFYIEPDELPLVASNSHFAGANARYAVTPDLSVDASYITIPQSDSTYAVPDGRRLSREGLRTVAGHLHWKRLLGIEGLWLESELAQQTHSKFSMSAWAAYGLAGYRFNDVSWKPTVSYRYAYASGDDPTTGRYERFDPLLSTGLGNWLQGINFGKATSNSNVAVHRVQINVTPQPEVNLTLDWHRLRALQLNNLGSNGALAQLASSDLGNEYSFTARWALSRHWYF